MSPNVKTANAIFYIDDDTDDLDFFKNAILTLEEDVELFSKASEMMVALNDPPPAPSMLFMDLNMPLTNGFELITEIKSSEQYKNLPIIIYSTAKDSATVEKCRLLGASLYINKPTSMPALLRTLKYVLSIDWEHFKAGKNDFLCTN